MRDPATITTGAEFVQYLEALAARVAPDYDLGLEAYLRALLGLVQMHSGEAPSWALLASLLHQAFGHAPLPFDPTWLRVTAPPSEDEARDPVDFVEEMLRYQIADLRRMAEAGILVNTGSYPLYAGRMSPTGHLWYNFHPQDFLDCAAHGYNGPLDATGDWYQLGDILWLGQIYE